MSTTAIGADCTSELFDESSIRRSTSARDGSSGAFGTTPPPREHFERPLSQGAERVWGTHDIFGMIGPSENMLWFRRIEGAGWAGIWLPTTCASLEQRRRASRRVLGGLYQHLSMQACPSFLLSAIFGWRYMRMCSVIKTDKTGQTDTRRTGWGIEKWHELFSLSYHTSLGEMRVSLRAARCAALRAFLRAALRARLSARASIPTVPPSLIHHVSTWVVLARGACAHLYFILVLVGVRVFLSEWLCFHYCICAFLSASCPVGPLGCLKPSRATPLL